MKDLHLIRCYGRAIDPATFRGRGIRGWWVRCLNRLRMLLERKVIYHVLTMLSDDWGPLADKHTVLRQYEQDMHPKDVRPEPPPLPITGSVEARLRELKNSRVVESPQETSERVFRRYASEQRSRRYAFSRNTRVLMDTEDDEPVLASVPTIVNNQKEEETHDREDSSNELISADDFHDTGVNESVKLRSVRKHVERREEVIHAAEEHQRSVLSGKST